MAETNQTYSTVVGYFSSHEQADRAIRALVDAGFNRTQIGIAGRSVGSFTTEDDRKRAEPHVSFWQRVKNFFEGEDSYADTLRRTDARQDFGSEDYYDYESGDFHQSLGSLSLPAEKSRYFNDRFGRDPNGVLLTVEAGTRRAEAEAILEQNGADIGRTSSTWSYDQTRDTTASGRAEAQRIQLYGEVLRVHRDRIQRGEARLRKETVTENQRVDVPVTREELVVEKVPVTGEKAAPGARIGEDSEVRVPLSEERVSVEKEPVVREEVRVGKKGVTNVESRDETLRREELHVEDKSKKAS